MLYLKSILDGRFMSDHNIYMPFVSVIVVNYNNTQLTCQCLESLLCQDYTSIEIILVDNGSENEIEQTVMNKFLNIRFFKLENNQGYAGGNNAGISVAKGEYIALINNDAIASKGWITNMVKTIKEDDSIGAVASVIIDGNNPIVLDSYGVGVALDGMSRQRMHGLPLPLESKKVEIFMPSGCACLIRRKVLDEVGLFDEDYFAYCEDTDLFLRIRWAGYRMVIVPDAQVTHYYSCTGGKFSLNKIYWVERNHYWVALKNFPLGILILMPFVTLWRLLLQIYSLMIDNKSINGFLETSSAWMVIKTIIKANIEVFVSIPYVINKRIILSRKHKLSSFDMIKQLWVYRMSMREIILGLDY